MKTLSKESERRREKRKKRTQEIFTPHHVVNGILNKLTEYSKGEVWEEEKKFFDPACGNGNFLIQILWRKLVLGHNPTKALETIFGIDIKVDNIRECRLKLLKIISLFKPVTKEHIKIVLHQIRFLNRKQFPNGALDYKERKRTLFRHNSNPITVDRWYKMIHEGEVNRDPYHRLKKTNTVRWNLCQT